mmetsp:Transcript_3335/g.3784  ORF Transcript_3335/g.3784 Transcript_3335/m.3784 type:complete len:227 (+) Transcript_3335:239-919(+)|eukprot:CAMPEP_0184006864 /NCGR_PEP_ID=MMETSP0954-20121128/965_1 /TAXON_ID=627963 /ORGANISM="Aplanochytrium sp, Strain PBS07" /LENGTH=226 /DNA_ID=CAMNT_0026285531 /DNA_START=322 /DNA_END=1002 /DNA_ORIENTATION=+
MANYHRLQGSETEATPVAFEVVVSRPKLQPDALAGCCCPAGTMLQHSSDKRKWRFVGYLEILLHIAFAVAWSFQHQLVDTYVSQNLDSEDVQNVVNDPMNMEAAQTLAEDIFTDSQMMAISAVYNVWMLWNIVVRAIFFCCYEPRKVAFEGNSPEEIMYFTPNVLARLFFPLASVYYHEGNVCNAKTLLACLCGPYYTLCFYKPSFTVEEQVQMQEVEVDAPAKQV